MMPAGEPIMGTTIRGHHPGIPAQDIATPPLDDAPTTTGGVEGLPCTPSPASVSGSGSTTSLVILTHLVFHSQAQTWVDGMSALEPEELNDKDFEGRPSGLGLGARVAPNAKRAAPTDPVERRLLGKVNAQKRKSAEEDKINTQGVGASDDDSGEPQGRTSACSKKRELPSVTSMPLGKKAK
ncbi:hypothetical protein TRIUR3_13745 [Triticum urartu]|uniref:Uncharacterized protein n=1 Tax=Triticum urartu TaxID=4572 RepID=M7YTU7_TRIUA|nr:hypothetical protein TRIUR3_13745 [Triticum urartu]